MKSLFTWLVATPSLHYFLALAVLLAFCVLAAVNRERPGKLRAEWLFLALAAGTLLVWRMPVMLWPEPMNLDEGEFAACAIKATRDFAPWRGFDASTSGPLNCYILMIPILFGGQITFFATRVIGFFLITLAVYALYFTAKWMLGSATARLAIVPPIALLALTGDPDFLQYSSEYFPIFLTSIGIAAGVYLAAHRGAVQQVRFSACLISGLCLGSAPFAKLQSLPIAVAGAMFIAGVIFGSRRDCARNKWTDLIALMVGLSITPGIIGLSLWRTGEWNYAIISYLKSSADYVDSGTTVGLGFFFAFMNYKIFLICSLVVIGAGAIALRSRWSFSTRDTTTFGCALGFLLVSLFAVWAARHPFAHYLLFTVLPLSFCVATVLYFTRNASLWKGREALISGLVVALFVLPELRVALAGPNPFRDIPRDRALPERQLEGDVSPFLCLRKSGPVVKAIRRHAGPGSAAAIWGWMPHYHVQAQTVMATRDATSCHQIDPTPYREFYRERFMLDIRAARPPVFVDAVAPGSIFYTNRSSHGYETFPALAAFIREHYELREDVEGVRIFVAEEFTK